MTGTQAAAKLIYERTSAVAQTVPYDKIDPISHEEYENLATEVAELVSHD